MKDNENNPAEVKNDNLEATAPNEPVVNDELTADDISTAALDQALKELEELEAADELSTAELELKNLAEELRELEAENAVEGEAKENDPAALDKELEEWMNDIKASSNEVNQAAPASAGEEVDKDVEKDLADLDKALNEIDRAANDIIMEDDENAKVVDDTIQINQIPQENEVVAKKDYNALDFDDLYKEYKSEFTSMMNADESKFIDHFNNLTELKKQFVNVANQSEIDPEQDVARAKSYMASHEREEFSRIMIENPDKEFTPDQMKLLKDNFDIPDLATLNRTGPAQENHEIENKPEEKKQEEVAQKPVEEAAKDDKPKEAPAVKQDEPAPKKEEPVVKKDEEQKAPENKTDKPELPAPQKPKGFLSNMKDWVPSLGSLGTAAVVGFIAGGPLGAGLAIMALITLAVAGAIIETAVDKSRYNKDQKEYLEQFKKDGLEIGKGKEKEQEIGKGNEKEKDVDKGKSSMDKSVAEVKDTVKNLESKDKESEKPKEPDKKQEEKKEPEKKEVEKPKEPDKKQEEKKEPEKKEVEKPKETTQWKDGEKPKEKDGPKIGAHREQKPAPDKAPDAKDAKAPDAKALDDKAAPEKEPSKWKAAEKPKEAPTNEKPYNDKLAKIMQDNPDVTTDLQKSKEGLDDAKSVNDMEKAPSKGGHARG